MLERKNLWKGGLLVQKIAIEVLEHAIRAGLSSSEVDMLLYIARYQNEAGIARGIYYKDVCENIQISYQAFYDCKKSLVEKGIIYAEKNNYFDWDITILNNSFLGKENFGRGYVSVASKMVRSATFRKLRANAKLMALYLQREWQISRKQTGKTAYQMLKETFLLKFRGLFGVADRMLRSYLTELQPFLSVYLQEGRKFFLTFKENEVKNREINGNDESREQQIKVACRRNKVKDISSKLQKDLMRLMSQYNPKITKHPEFDLSRVMGLCLERININISKKNSWKREINAALMNKIMQEQLVQG